MQKSKGGWAKVGVMTALLCLCAGVGYGFWWQQQQTVLRQKAEPSMDAFEAHRLPPHAGALNVQVNVLAN